MVERILIGIAGFLGEPQNVRPRLALVCNGSAAHLRKASPMANTANMKNSDHHLMDQERYQIGGRDTVLLVWSLITGIVVVFLLLVH